MAKKEYIKPRRARVGGNLKKGERKGKVKKGDFCF